MDQTQLEAMGCGSETVTNAIALYRKAKPRTAPGSGHALGELSTSLLPICALLASEQLNNGEITQEVARVAACVEKAKFNKAVMIVRAALHLDTSQKKATSFSSLLEQYVPHLLVKAQLQNYCKLTQDEAKALGMRSVDLKSNDTICTIFYWVCAAAKLKGLPEAQDFAKTHSVSAKRLSDLASSLSKKLASLRKQIGQETKALTARTPSPTKKATTATPLTTPRRSARAHREILTKESVKKRPTPTTTQSPTPGPSKAAGEPRDEDDDATSFPESPTKRRKLDSSPSKSPSRVLFPNAPASSSRLALDGNLDPPQTPRKSTRLTASRGSPLKHSTTLPQEDADVDMEEPEVLGVSDEEEEEEDDEPHAQLFRRFRPVYLEQKKWSARDPRLERLMKVGEKRKLEYFQLYGNPFKSQAVEV